MSHQKSIKAELTHQLKVQGKNNPTYKSQINTFCKWLVDRGEKKATIDQAKERLQEYLDNMRNTHTPDSIHTACASVCAALRVPMSDYNIPQRGAPTRGRDVTERVVNEHNERVVEFAKMVGIREKEYAKLRGDNLLERNGDLYVVVERGKGGKYQEQYIRERDREDVRSYFNGSREPVFSTKEVRACEHANLHSYRREHAQEMYQEFLKMDREKVKELVRDQFMRGHERRLEQYGVDKFKLDEKLHELEKKYESKYHCRGDIREDHLQRGLPVEYDRLALIATSCLCLSHWRVNVCVKHYMG